MPVRLDHTIVYCRDKQVSALFVSEILGLPAPRREPGLAAPAVTLTSAWRR